MELGLFTKWYNTNKETVTTSQNTRTYKEEEKPSQAFTRISKSNNKKK